MVAYETNGRRRNRHVRPRTEGRALAHEAAVAYALAPRVADTA